MLHVRLRLSRVRNGVLLGPPFAGVRLQRLAANRAMRSGLGPEPERRDAREDDVVHG